METVALLQRLPDVAEYYRRRFRHVLVDEYQDTNHAQYVLVRELVAPPTRVRSRGSCASSATRTSRSTRSGARASATSPSSSATSAMRTRPAGAELPLDADDPHGGERRHRAQPGPPRQAPVDGRGRRAARRRVRRGQRARRGRVRRGRDRPARGRRRDPQQRRRGLLPDERPVARLRRRLPSGRAAVQGGRRGALLRASGDPRRAGVPAGAVEPGRHGEPAAHPQRAQARHRRPGRGAVAQYADRERISFAAALRVAAEQPERMGAWPRGRSGASPASCGCSTAWRSSSSRARARQSCWRRSTPHGLHRRAGGERRPAGRVAAGEPRRAGHGRPGVRGRRRCRGPGRRGSGGECGLAPVDALAPADDATGEPEPGRSRRSWSAWRWWRTPTRSRTTTRAWSR